MMLIAGALILVGLILIVLVALIVWLVHQHSSRARDLSHCGCPDPSSGCDPSCFSMARVRATVSQHVPLVMIHDALVSWERRHIVWPFDSSDWSPSASSRKP